ncbi:MAG: SpoIIE family protein phosphatase [Anaerolineae bacterium]|nr:SpoIIE family protein phosphatase [Anaerolineae bacterium]
MAQPIEHLNALNRIATLLAGDEGVEASLDQVLQELVTVMGVSTAWLFLYDPALQTGTVGRGYRLAASCGLPSGLLGTTSEGWSQTCLCQNLCNDGLLDTPYAKVICSRLIDLGEQADGLGTHASALLRSSGRMLGILNVAVPSWEMFSPEALALLEGAAGQIATALDRARLNAMLQEQRLVEQDMLFRLSRELLRRDDFDDLIRYIVAEVPHLLHVDACALLLRDADGNMAFRAANGWHSDPVEHDWRVPAGKKSGARVAIETRRPLVIPDISVDDHGLWLPGWFLAEGFLGHIVVPLIAKDEPIGAVIIDSRQPLQLAPGELRFAQLVANLAAIAIDKAHLFREAMQRQRLENELGVARHIQTSLLPPYLPRREGWEFAAFYEPARAVGGDFYDFFSVPKGTGVPPTTVDQLAMVIADVSDKGIPAAIYMALSRTLIRSTGMSGRTPGPALERASELIQTDSRSDLFLSAVFGLLDTATGRLVYANAGHNPPILLRARTGKVERLNAKGIILGVFEPIELEEREIDIEPGDMLVFYTDGLTEMENEQGQQFGMERLLETLRVSAGTNAEQAVTAISTAVSVFTGGASPSDDITFFIVKRLVY